MKKRAPLRYLIFTLSTFIAAIFLLPLCAGAQSTKFSTEPDKFATEVVNMFNVSKTEAMAEAASTFSSSWANHLPAHQKSMIALAQSMQKTKKFRPSPHYADLFSVLAIARNKNLPNTQIDSLIYILSKSVSTMSAVQFGNMLQTFRLILDKGIVYKSNFNSLLVSGGSFRFGYIEPKSDEPLPDMLPTASDTHKVETDLDKRKEDFFSDWDNAAKVENEWSTLPADTIENVLDVGYQPPIQPAIQGAVIVFDKVDFTIKSPYDSTTVFGTSGSMMLKNNVFVGKGGKADWTSAGLSATEVYCDLKEYNFNIKSAKILAEGATLHYPSKTDKPVDGIFEFDSKRHLSYEDNQYPRFKSFTNNIHFKGFGDNIKYRGGFSLSGKRIYSSSVDEGFGTIEILHEGAVKIKSLSNKFELGDSTISADIANIVLYQGENDSIYHYGTIFKFKKNTETLKVQKHSNFRQSPFIDTYHKVEIVSDAITWNLNSPKIDFGILNAKDQIPATFESEAFFSANKYAAMLGLYRFHPLQMIVGYSEKVKSNEFYADDVAKSLKFPEATVRGAMFTLMKNGFIDYDSRNGLVKLRPKAIHYVMSNRKKKDYDNITFVSVEPSGNNATLDLTNHELTVRGVDKISINDSLSVFFKPDSGEVRILKNRDFKFNGEIRTENFQFKGKDFQFSYDSFLVHLPTIEAIKLSLKQKDSKGGSKSLTNELSYSSGTLYINKPDNKSGRKRFAQYPIFDANTGATVTFNKSNIAQGAYDSTMQFKIPPFRMDSLSSDDPNSIGFAGEFNSGGILPPFKERLVVMPDHSLGFQHKVPERGFELYEGKGKFFNKITLDNQGLRGDGVIHYLNATLQSKDFLFLKDSVLTVGTSFVNKEGGNEAVAPEVKYPDVVLNDYKMKWLPKSDKLFISDIKTPIQFYQNTATLQGTLNLTSRGMYGEGILLTRGSEAESNKFQFEQHQFSGRDAGFQIKSDNPKKPALLCKMVKLHFDLEKAIAHFSPEVVGSATNEFPYAMYKSSLDNGTWDLKKKTVTMKMPEGGDINKSYFYSTRLDQDSLVFNATEAVYDITQLTLNIKGIPYIKVADGKILPADNKIFVKENAVIQTLENARVVLDTLNEYHHLYDGKIDIRSRFKFEGSATYQYVNLGADTLAIKFSEFRLHESGQKKEATYTIATGLVNEEDNLRVGPKIFYKGQVVMYAPKKYLSFDGYIRLDLKGELKNSQWLKYVNMGDSSEVVINMENATAMDGQPLSSGLHMDNTSNELYTTFTSVKKAPEDVDIISSNGLMNFNGERNEFTVATAAKLKDHSKQGNLITYQDDKSAVAYQGRFKFLRPDKNMQLDATGTGEGSLRNNKYSFNSLLAFRFKLHGSVYEALGKSMKQVMQFQEDTTGAAELEAREQGLNYKIMELGGQNAFEKLRTKRSSLSQVSSELGSAIVLSEVNLIWSPEHKSYYSKGPLYISNILKEDINRPCKGYIEIRKNALADIVNIYLEPTEEAWYFITYDENRLALASHNDELNKAIDNKADGEKMDRIKFFTVRAEDSEKSQFVAEFNRKYSNLSFTIPKEKEISVPVKQVAAPNLPVEKALAAEDKSAKEYDVDTSPMQADKKKGKKYKKSTEFNMENFEETEEQAKKSKTTVEQQKQSQQDQQKMKSLLGN